MVTRIFAGISNSNGDAIALYMIDGRKFYIACENDLYSLGGEYTMSFCKSEPGKITLRVTSKLWSGEALGILTN